MISKFRLTESHPITFETLKRSKRKTFKTLKRKTLAFKKAIHEIQIWSASMAFQALPWYQFSRNAQISLHVENLAVIELAWNRVQILESGPFSGLIC